jgi:phospholipid/cholesterol/gamma-HCH transport system permease protein
MEQGAHFILETGSDGVTSVVLSGPLLVSTLAVLDGELRGLAGPIARIDIAAVPEIDTAGAWLVSRLAHDHDAAITGASDKAARLLAAVRAGIEPTAANEARQPFVARMLGALGHQVVGTARGSVSVLGFFGELLVACGHLLLHPRRFRMKALVHQMELVGIDSLLIIAVMSFLIGIVIAQQGAVQLQQFGAEIYTINLTGRLAMRELGVLMTAIMLAGRSGSAFAAQLGTMKLTEEIDAMRTIGVSPMEALVVPRVLAAAVMLPLLGFFSAVVAIIGGAALGEMMLNIPFITFISRIQEVVPVSDMWVGLVKGPVFGLIIGLTGCYQGLQVSGNSEEVGTRTTLAVVQAIFVVIVLDAFFAVFFTQVGWK